MPIKLSLSSPLRLVLCMTLLATALNLENHLLFAMEPSEKNLQTVIFEVSLSFHESDQTRPHEIIRPIVIIEGSRYSEPSVTCNKSEEFGMTWFRLGSKYRVLSGDEEARYATVTKWLIAEPDSCDHNTAMVDMKPARRLGQGETLLATNSRTLEREKSLRRLPTPEEEAKILELGRKAFRDNEVGKQLIQGMQTSQLAVIDVDGDGINEMVGTFLIETQMKNEAIRHDLFLLLEKQNGIYLPAISWFHTGSGAETHLKTFIGNVDLDQDGVQELIVEQMFACEMTRYQIYSKRKSDWQSIYEGGGSQC
ncbi:MAG: hypothetical protein OEY77_02295 [Nitrospira sp.]|nr:hypothetical protein [Nitrospira sp.]